MPFTLAPQAARAGFRLKSFDAVGSTNAEALSLGCAGETGPIWLVTAHQTEGRGRRGRAWESPPGNLAASLLRTVDLPPSKAATIGFVAGLALEAALAAVAPALDLRAPDAALRPPAAGKGGFALKWPNDILVDGAKLAGILLESESVGDSRIVVVGIGVNVAAAPQAAPYPVTSLADLGFAVTAEALFEALSAAWVDLEALWNRGEGMADIRRLWLASAAGLGAPIAVRIGSSVARGVFETIDEAGQLILRQADGSRRTVAAGEVHFGAAATVAGV